MRAGGVVWRTVRCAARIEPFLLELRCSVGPDRLEIETESVPGALEAGLDDLLLDRYLQALESFDASSAETPIGRLRVVPDEELRAVLSSVSDAAEAEGKEVSAGPPGVLELFGAAVREVPDRVAVASGELALSFHALERWARVLADRLRSEGASPGTLVGILAERSPGTVAGLLAVLKVGGAYVPLDPSLPLERLRAMAEGVGLAALLAQEGTAERGAGLEVPVIPLDPRPPSVSAAAEPSAGAAPAAENLVYAVYTSGSTGAPKAVGVEHRQLARYVASVTPRMGLDEGASHGLVSTFAADLGNTTLFSALCSRGRLEVAEPEEAFDPDRFARYCADRRLDCLKIVPSHLEAMLRLAREPCLPPAGLLVLGGEAASQGLLETLASATSPCPVMNHYGPTEVTVGACAHRVEAEQLDAAAGLPLGTALDGYRLLCLGDDLEPVPLGAPGELFVGGGGVARGYLGRPGGTAERFVPDPFSGAGARLYRTGDLVRLGVDRSLSFLGRVDHQLKVRGYRVELGEIEATLRSHPQVADAAVAGRETEADGGMELVAYLVAQGRQRLTVADLRGHLESWLPEPMIPTHFILVGALPLTANGKLDRRALADLQEVERVEELREYVAPRNPVEEVLAGIWTEVLGADRVGVEDDFFALGGHSLLAMQILSRVQESFGMELPLRVVFQATTVSALADALAAEEPEPGYVERAARTVQRVNAMSPEEIESLLAAEGGA